MKAVKNLKNIKVLNAVRKWKFFSKKNLFLKQKENLARIRIRDNHLLKKFFYTLKKKMIRNKIYRSTLKSLF